MCYWPPPRPARAAIRSANAGMHTIATATSCRRALQACEQPRRAIEKSEGEKPLNFTDELDTCVQVQILFRARCAR